MRDITNTCLYPLYHHSAPPAPKTLLSFLLCTSTPLKLLSGCNSDDAQQHACIRPSAQPEP